MNKQDKHLQPDARPGDTYFIIAFLAFALFLLSQLGTETKFSASGKLFAQPRFWPAVSVAGMVLFGFAHLAIVFFNRTSSTTTSKGALSEVLNWARALEYLLWFLIYVQAVPIIGYLPATVLFTVLLAARQGYRSRRQLTTAAAVGVGIVLVFKTGLSVRIPGGAIYEYLPQTLRNIAIIYF